MSFAPFNLAGKVCVITGGNRGLGLGMAEGLAACDADVAIWGRNAEANAEAVKKLEGLGKGKVAAWQVDVAEEDQIVKAMAESEEHFGRIDACFANAGISQSGIPFEELTLDSWQYINRINTEGVFLTLREAGKTMVKRAKAGDPGGSLAAVASLAGISGAARNEAYGASKGAVISMMKAIAAEYGRYLIRANAILPGWTATDLTEGLQKSDTFNAKAISRTPIRRWGQPEDFAGIAIYLASDASKFHSGDTILIDGGYSVF